MSRDATVDVIIPTYNSMPWLREAVDSVLAQTHRDFTLYIIDDGSTDDTAQYVKSLRDKRVVYIYQQNARSAHARNTGVKASSGEFVAFLDADDWWEPQKLEKQLAVMTSDSAIGLVYGHCYVSDEAGIITRNLRISKRGRIADELAGGNLIAGSASMVLLRRSVLDKVGLMREDFINGEDWELWLRIAMISKIDVVPDILATIRQRGGSVQAGTRRMADGLVYACGVMLRELPLSKLQRHRVASYCLFNAADMYLAIGDRWTAKKVLLRLFRTNPTAFFTVENWKLSVKHSLFARVVFGNPLFDLLRRTVRQLFRGIRRIFRFGFRVVRYFGRKLKRLFGA